MRALLLGTAFSSAFCALLSTSAVAAPLMLSKSEAVGTARTDAGTGLCGTVVKFTNQATPLSMIDQAVVLLDKPSNDPSIVSRVSRLFQKMNFSVGTGSEADLRAPAFPDESFPYCQDPGASPPGTDDNNIAMRLRGYLNVTSPSGQPVTFAVKVDDACMVRIGKSRQLLTQANDDSPQLTGRRARWVSFSDPGLYPVEIVYFQNSTSGYFEWSRASTSVFSNDDTAVDNLQWGQQSSAFSPVPATELFGAAAGSNSACTECGAAGQSCAGGNYCGDGLCQTCVVADHCGDSCQACPTSARVCSSGRCVECARDADCAGGSTCDTVAGQCKNVTCSDPTRCEGSGGGCSCEAAGRPSPPSSTPAGAWLLLGGALLIAGWRLRRRVTT